MEKTFTVDVVGLKKIMLDHNIGTIGELSEVTGVDRNTLGRILKNKAKPSATVMEKLIESLNIPLDEAGYIFFNSNLREKKENKRRTQ